jgi:hypothetical protein
VLEFEQFWLRDRHLDAELACRNYSIRRPFLEKSAREDEVNELEMHQGALQLNRPVFLLLR